MKKWKEHLPTEPKAQEPKAPNNPHESTIFAAELGTAVTIDLHGLDVNQATSDLDQFLNHEFMQGTEVVKIIHGRGEQKLKKMVEAHLKNNPLIDYSRGAQSPGQQGAVTYAVLVKK
ncbi:MAG: Smr/MutS family protein [Patescibacteria group bacterium]